MVDLEEVWLQLMLRTESLCSPSSYVEILTLNVIILGGGAFGVIGSEGWDPHEWD